MNSVRLVAAYLWQRRLASALHVLMLAIGVATLALLMLVTTQAERRLAREATGIDLVVGAKGSPLQLILSALFQVDVPTGNVPLSEIRALARNPAVALVIPLSLGDSFRGFRIVGTEIGYLEQFGGRLADGAAWAKPLEAVLGSQVARATGLRVGDRFSGAHGLGGEGAAHGESPYRVVGVLAPAGNVLDRLVLTSLESVWVVHAGVHGGPNAPPPAQPADAHAGTAEDHAPSAHDHEADDGREVTAALVRYRSPLAAASLPRVINSQTRLQAASPPFEIARLMAVFGVGVDALRTLAWVLVTAAALGVFVALYQALTEREYDIAIMRTLGASRGRVVAMLLLESLLLVVPGLVLGLATGHVVASAIPRLSAEAAALGISGARMAPGEAWVVVVCIASGILAAALPAWRAYRLDVAATLAKG